MKDNRKRILAGFLAAVMAVTMLPATAFAADESIGEPVPDVVISGDYNEGSAMEEIPEQGTEETARESVKETDSDEETAESAKTEKAAAREEQNDLREEHTDAQEDMTDVREEQKADSREEESAGLKAEQEEKPQEEIADEPAQEEQTREKDESVNTLETHGSDYVVTITYDASSGVRETDRVKVEEVFENSKKYDYNDYVEQAAEAIETDAGSVSYVRLFDISIINENKEKVILTGPVGVQIRLKDMKKDQEAMQVVHFAEESTDVIEPEVENNKVAFSTEGFSVYAIIDTDPRMAVNFYGPNNTLIKTEYVKKADIADPDFDKVIFDPGTGVVPEGYTFYGWSTDMDMEDPSQAETIVEIRENLKENEGANIVPGTSINYYGVYLAYYTVEYIDNSTGVNVSLGKDTHFVKVKNAPVSYKVNMEYAYDSGHEFDGWRATSGIDNIVDNSGNEENPRIFPNGTMIQIKGDVTFSVKDTEISWIIFKENGQGATYNAPKPVETNTVPSLVDMEVIEPTRIGYTFDGWWTGAPLTEGGYPTGSRYKFVEDLVEGEEGTPIRQDTVLYAKWKSSETAIYTINVWLETLTDDTYEYYTSYQYTGTVGSMVQPVQLKYDDSSDNRTAYAQITKPDGTTEDLRIKGFRLAPIDLATSKPVRTEGDTVFNIKFKRNSYHLIFRAKIGTTHVYKWDEYQNFWAKYGSYIGYKFPIQKDSAWTPIGNMVSNVFRNVGWTPDTTSQTYGDDPVYYIYETPAEDITFNKNTPWDILNTTYHIDYYVDMVPGETMDTDTYLYTEYNGKTYRRFGSWPMKNAEVGESTLATFTGLERVGSTPELVNSQATITSNEPMNVFYDRVVSRVQYVDGVYVDGKGIPVKSNVGSIFKTESAIFGESLDVTKFKDYVPELSSDSPDHDKYVFEGWYGDSECTEEFDFEREMPGYDVKIYAKWHQIQYRVFLKPNMGSYDTNPGLTWKGSTSMSFLVSYGDSVSFPEGIFMGYQFIGWFYDQACTKPVNASYLPLDKNVETMEYGDEQKNDPVYYTEVDDYGNVTENLNKDKERFWVTRMFFAYAKWKRITIGAPGINVIYDLNGGSDENLSDPQFYGNEADAVALRAPSTPPNGKVFTGWDVQRWNGEQGEFKSEEKTVLPGQTFTVRVENARIMDEEDHVVALSALQDDTNYRYAVQLKALYMDKESETFVDIKWFNNDENGSVFFENNDVGINNAVSVPYTDPSSGHQVIPERTGYKFLGWTKDIINADGKTAKTELLIEYDGNTGTYNVNNAAADLLGDEEAFYAVWEKMVEYHIVHSSDGNDEIFYVDKDLTEPIDLTLKVSNDCLYGGYRLSPNGNLETSSGKRVTYSKDPENPTTFYLREVDANYLKPQIYITYYENYAQKKITGSYALVNVDDTSGDIYEKIGISVEHTKRTNVEGTVNHSQTVDLSDFYSNIYLQKEGQEKENIPYSNLFGSYFKGSDSPHPCYAGMIKLDMDYNYAGDEVVIRTYFVTKDNIRVPGKKIRKVRFGDGCFYKKWDWEVNNNAGIGSCTELSEERPAEDIVHDSDNSPDSASTFTAKPRNILMYSIMSPGSEQKQYTVTKMIGTESKIQKVAEGSCTGQITYTKKPDAMFAGWYLDKACKNPADFSNVTGDMTVYAKYVSKSDISFSLARTGGLIGNVPFEAAVSVKAAAKPDDIEVVFVKGSDTASAALTTTVKENIGTKKKPVYLYKHKGSAKLANIRISDEFTAQVIWTTPDGTRVEGQTYTVQYDKGNVLLQ